MTSEPPGRDRADSRARKPGCHRFPRRLRVTQRADFERALRDGLRTADGRLTLWAHPNGLPHARLGLIVGRKLGNAVQRNRAKRLWREAFRLAQHDLPAGLDLVCAPRPSEAPELSRCVGALNQLAARLGARWRRRGFAEQVGSDA